MKSQNTENVGRRNMGIPLKLEIYATRRTNVNFFYPLVGGGN